MSGPMRVRNDVGAVAAQSALTGPRAGALPPEAEKQYQIDMAFSPAIREWRKSFTLLAGGAPNTETDPSFDYRKAWAAGDIPKMSSDGTPHWGSSGKTAGHETKWKAEFVDKFGVDPDEIPQKDVTPSMQRFMSEKIGRVSDRALRAGLGYARP